MNTDHRLENNFQLNIRNSAQRTVVSVIGDCDPTHRELFTSTLRSVLAASAITELDLSRAGVFGSAAIAAVVEARRDASQPTLVIVDPAPHIARVLDVTQLGIPVEEREPRHGGAPPDRIAFDQLIARSVTTGREAMCITTGQLDAPGPEIVYVNPAFCALTGYSSNEILGATPRLLQGALTDRPMLDRLRSQLEQDENFHGETVNYRKDGSPFFMNWKISAVDTDQARYFVAHQVDATTSVRATRYVTASSLVETAGSVASNERRSALVEALRAAHHVLLGSGDVEASIFPNHEGDDQTDPSVRRIRLDRALTQGPVVSETDDGGYELAVAAEGEFVRVEVVVTGITDDHLRLTEIDAHHRIAQLVAGFATADTPDEA